MAHLKHAICKVFHNLSRRRLLSASALKKMEISILLTGNLGIRKLNKQWRKKDRATDVLSFPQYTEAELKNFPMKRTSWSLGDVVLNVERARVDAKKNKITLRAELDRLLIHGIVHLLGYDHELGEKEAKRMERLEKYLLGHHR